MPFRVFPRVGLSVIAIGLAATCALLLAPLAQARKRCVAATDRPAAQLILLHGGSFLFEDPAFRPETEAAAIAAGFLPHYLDYPLGDLGAAVASARAEAVRLRRRFGPDRVYVYGSSAGGTLAAILSGDGLVAGGVAKAPVSDLAGWGWPQINYGPDYSERIQADPRMLRRLSPLRRAQRRPLLVIQGRADHVVPPSMNEAFAAKFRRVHLRVVPGGHTTDRVRPWVVGQAMRWLVRLDDCKR